MKLPKNFTPHKPCNLENLSDLKFTQEYYYVQPKLDGIRCIVVDGKLLSNTLKPIPNKQLWKRFEPLIEYCKFGMVEGELIIEGKSHQDTQSIVMSDDTAPGDIRLVVFDRIINGEASFKQPYRNRRGWCLSLFGYNSFENIYPIPTDTCFGLEKIEMFENHWVGQGYEGIIIRAPDALYKFGRATIKEDAFFKFKRTEDAEAMILDTIPLEHNLNEKTTDERGYAKRTSHKANKEKSNMAGSLLVSGINGRYKDKTFKVSLGSVTQSVRKWFMKEHYKNINRIITYKYAKHRGTDDAPAEPRFMHFRAKEDIS